MFTFISKIIGGGHRKGSDWVRLGFMLAVVAVLLWLDSWLPAVAGEAVLSPLLTSSAIVMGLAALSHLTRRVLFPRLDLQELGLKAAEHPIGAGVVFLGISSVLAVLIVANVSMLR